MATLRKHFHSEFPRVEVSFNTGGLIRATLNEGKTAPIDIHKIGAFTFDSRTNARHIEHHSSNA